MAAAVSMGPYVVYISGPMTGLPEYNYPAFNAAAAALRAAGYAVENPAENPEPPCKSWQGYMRSAIVQVTRAHALYLLAGWQRSRGARLEVQIALELELTIDFDGRLLLPNSITSKEAHHA
jgi:hypothetical protein